MYEINVNQHHIYCSHPKVTKALVLRKSETKTVPTTKKNDDMVA